MFRQKVTPPMNYEAIKNLKELVFERLDKLEVKLDLVKERIDMDRGAGLENRFNSLGDTVSDLTNDLTALKEWRVLKNEKEQVIGEAGSQKKSLRRT